MSLRVRFAAYLSLIVAVALGAACAFFYRAQRSAVERQIRLRQQDALGSLLKVSQESLLAHEDIALINYLRELAAKPEVISAEVTGADGSTLAHPDPARVGAPARPIAPDSELLAAPVLDRGRRIGEARIAYDRAAVRRRARATALESVREFLRTVVLGSMALGMAAAWTMALGLTRPMRQLSEGARRIALGRLDQRIDLRRKDELGQLAEEFNLMAQRIGELDRIKRDFVNTIVHDLRNPLTSLRGYAELIEDSSGLDEQSRGLLKDVLRLASRLNAMVDDILDEAKFEEGMMKLRLEAGNLCALAKEVHAMFLPIAKGRRLGLELSLDADPAPVHIDAPLIRRVMENLVGNALKFTSAGEKVRLRVDRSGGAYRFSVIDNGCGIPPEQMKNLFQKFRQIEDLKSRSPVRGTGLGLAICKSSVEAHGGRVGAESEVGKGSTFFIVLPELAASAAAQPAGAA